MLISLTNGCQKKKNINAIYINLYKILNGVKKIGIITILKVNNYGAELQSVALPYVLNKHGYKAEIIDYLFYKNSRHQFSKEDVPMNGGRWEKWIKNIIKYRIINCILDNVIPFFSKNQRLRNERFRNFNNKCSAYSEEYRSMSALYKYHQHYDVYITGSDCVWCYYTDASIEPYFLTFAPQNARKLSYASSFGVSEIPGNLWEKYKKLIENIDVISVRETHGVNIIRNLCNRKAELVLDPTLLLDKEAWKEFQLNQLNLPRKKYVLVYQLYPSEKLISIAKKIANDNNLPIWCICKRALFNPVYKDVKNIADAGPSEFLSYIMNAKCVVTDSFHGTAFSVNFNVDFYTVLSKTKKDNSRMESFLELLNLQKRLIWQENDGDIKYESIDFNEANVILNKERNKSISFILNAIEK